MKLRLDSVEAVDRESYADHQSNRNNYQVFADAEMALVNQAVAQPVHGVA